jgi:multiple sugar transport system permease protein
MKKQLSVFFMFLRTMLYLVISVICLVILYPYFAMFCTALKSRAEIFSVNGTILLICASVYMVSTLKKGDE